jgi:transcriptional regulator with XRE-family HTH domain
MVYVTPESEAFGMRLEALRRYHGRRTGRPRIKAKAFADEIGVNAWRYRRWERGEMEPPLFVLRAIRRVTGLSLDWLVCDLAPGDVLIPDFAVATPGDRLRWAREITHASAADAARAMSIPIDQWAAFESGRTQIPLTAAQEFCHRFSVSLDYIYEGKMEGVHPRMRDALLDRRPQLLGPSRSPRNGDGESRDTDTATGFGSTGRRAEAPPKQPLK